MNDCHAAIYEAEEFMGGPATLPKGNQMNVNASLEYQGGEYIVAIYADPESAEELADQIGNQSLASEIINAAQEAHRYNSTNA